MQHTARTNPKHSISTCWVTATSFTHNAFGAIAHSRECDSAVKLQLYRGGYWFNLHQTGGVQVPRGAPLLRGAGIISSAFFFFFFFPKLMWRTDQSAEVIRDPFSPNLPHCFRSFHCASSKNKKKKGLSWNMICIQAFFFQHKRNRRQQKQHCVIISDILYYNWQAIRTL